MKNDDIIKNLAREAYRIRDNRPRYDHKSADERRITIPDNLFEDSPKTYEDFTARLKKISGGKYTRPLRSILTMVELFKNRTSTTETTILYLPVTSKYLTDVFGRFENATRAVNRCEKVGLIQCVDPTWSHSATGSFARLWAWCKPVERFVIRFATEYGIEAHVPHSVSMKRALDEYGKNRGWIDKADGLEIKIAQRTALPKDLSDAEIVEALLERYPQIRDAMEKAVKLNEGLPEAEQIACMPNIQRSRSGTVTRIGFRITNPIVSAKVHDNQNDAYNGPWLKRDVLEPVLGQWVEYDVKSSIYRVTYLVNHGVWLPNDVDLYPKMSGYDFPTPDDRTCYKQFAMSLYFDSSARSIYNHLHNKGLSVSNSDPEIVEALVDAQDRMSDVCGPSLRSEIFVHESCIYLEAFRRMVAEKGWRVIQVYDGFYIRGNDPKIAEEAREIVAQSAMWYKAKYL